MSLPSPERTAVGLTLPIRLFNLLGFILIFGEVIPSVFGRAPSKSLTFGAALLLIRELKG